MFDYQRVVKVDLDGVSLSVPQKCWVWGDPKMRSFDLWVVEGIEHVLGMMAVGHSLSSGLGL